MTRALLLLLVGVGLAAWAVNLPRQVSRERLERRLWRHCDEVLGARKLEADRRASRRRVLQFFSHDLANLVYPAQQLHGAMAYPGRRRRRRYVYPAYSGVPWPKRLHRWHIRGVTLRWTSEAPVSASGDGWFGRLEKQVAQALGLEWHHGLFSRDVDWSRDLVTLARAKAAHVPDQLAAEEELGA
jgi:hypothetical protein